MNFDFMLQSPATLVCMPMTCTHSNTPKSARLCISIYGVYPKGLSQQPLIPHYTVLIQLNNTTTVGERSHCQQEHAATANLSCV